MDIQLAPGFTPQKGLEPWEEDAPEIRRLRSTNFLFDKYAPQWTIQLSSYEGGPSFASRDNLIKHARENDEDFQDRVNRLHYFNYIDGLVNFFTDYIFAETIIRDWGDESTFLSEFSKNVDRRGNDVNTYMRDVCEDMHIFGMVYNLVDAPPKPELGRPITTAEEQELGLRPYWVKVSPLEVIDWVKDDFNQYLYLKRKQPRQELIDGQVVKIEKYTEWYTDRVVVSKLDISDIARPKIISQDELANDMGMIPVYVTIDNQSKEDPEMGRSFLTDFAHNAKAILNITSLIDEFLAKQCFAILVKEAEQGIPTREQNQGEIGTANALEVPKDAKFPTYIAPDVATAEFLRQERQTIVNEMFKRAAQDMQSSMQNGEASSGFSQAQSFSRTMPRIANRADALQRTEMALFNLTMAFTSKSFNGAIKYKDDYNITNFNDAVTQFLMLTRDLRVESELFIKTEMKRLVHEYDGQLSTEQIAQIESQIDSIDIKEWLEFQKEALVGLEKVPPGTSPAAQQKPKQAGTMASTKASAQRQKPGASKKLKGK